MTSEVADIASESIEPYAGAKAALRHLSRTLAEEEPALTVVSYDPGPCDTQLMAEIRRQATASMRPELAAAYHDLHESGSLVRPQDTARVLAWLATSAPKAWSGRVVDHADAGRQNRRASRTPRPLGDPTELAPERPEPGHRAVMRTAPRTPPAFDLSNPTRRFSKQGLARWIV